MSNATQPTLPGTRPAKLGRELPTGQIRLRSKPPGREQMAKVDEDGGRFGGGLLEGVSLATRGEALGHALWMDSETIATVASMVNANEKGIKSRFTHPTMSSDGMGRYLGRLQEAEVVGDQAVADLHIAMIAHNTPEGDLAEYVMSIASEDPEAAGLSIVFEYDEKAMVDFALAHGAEWDEDTGYLDWSEFQSPDELNTENLPHVRMAELRAADIVDEPAANPAGLFDRQSAPRDADRFLAFAAKLTEESPGAFQGIDPERARAFLGRWLDSHGLQLSQASEEPPVADKNDNPVATEPTETTREKFQAELDRYTEAFGAEDGTKWFRDGVPFEECQGRQLEALRAENEELRQELAAEREKLESLSLGEDEPVDVTTDPEASKSRVSFSDFFASSEASQN